MTENTVEKNILDLGARKGLSLFTRGQAEQALDISKFEQGSQVVDAPKKIQKKKGDFVAK